ncbi:hypothetical protein HG530_003796 [Fusarium avenaceum]|nr:hypothetical protein HG530_003796 [Fusarium avenaceum]
MSVFVETTFLKCSMPRNFCVKLAGRHSRGLARLCLCKSIGAVLDKLEDASWASLYQSPMQRGESLLICRMDACAPAKKEVDDLGKAFVSRPHKRRMTEGVQDVDGNALVKKEGDEEDMAVESRDVEGVVALSVGNQRVCSMLEE